MGLHRSHGGRPARQARLGRGGFSSGFERWHLTSERTQGMKRLTISCIGALLASSGGAGRVRQGARRSGARGGRLSRSDGRGGSAPLPARLPSERPLARLRLAVLWREPPSAALSMAAAQSIAARPSPCGVGYGVAAGAAVGVAAGAAAAVRPQPRPLLILLRLPALLLPSCRPTTSRLPW